MSTSVEYDTVVPSARGRDRGPSRDERGRAGLRARLGRAGRPLGLAACALLAFGCGGDSAGPDPAPSVARVDVAGATNAISIDETVQLTATAFDGDDNVLVGKQFTWSSNNEGVATVSTSGLVRGVAGGPVTISATTDNRSGSFAIQVTAPEPVVVSAVTPNPLVPGQPATISGSGFSAVPQNNTVTIGGTPTTVNAATTTSLTVSVPGSLCTGGDAPVQVRVGTRTSNAFPAAAQINGTAINLAAGQQLVLTDPAAFCLQFGASSSSEAYLIGVQSVSESGSLVTSARVSAVPAASAPASAASPLAAAAAASRAATRLPIDRALVDRRRRHQAAEAEHQRGDAAMTAPYLDQIAEYHRLRASREATAAATIPSGLNVGDNVEVRVLSTTQCNQFATITTTVQAIGQFAVLLADAANPANGYTAADFQSLATYFDDLVYTTDTDYFGSPGDVDGNSRIAIVVTREVNERGGDLLGFVTTGDLNPQCQGGNLAELIYAVAPDPTGSAGFQYSLEAARADSRWLLAHEFVHVIQNGRRIPAGNGSLAGWQSEGQAVYAEQLVGFAATGRQPAQNYGFSVIFNCADPLQGCANALDEFDWFVLTFLDLLLYYGFDLSCNVNVPGSCDTPIQGTPEQCTWVQDDTGQPCFNREIYGVPAVFLTWLTDQFGPSFAGGRQGLHRQMIGNPQTGFASITALVGQPMNQLLAQWAAMLYVDDRVAGADPRLYLPSWNLFDFASLLRVSAQLRTRDHAFAAFSDLVQIRGGSAAYFKLSGAGRPETAVRVRRSDEGVLPAGMQVFIVRLQ